MTNHDNSIWATPKGAEIYAEAKRLWATTAMSVKAIARTLNINPGMLSGKCHRNRADFPPRFDPIQWKEPRRRAAPKVARPKKQQPDPTERIPPFSQDATRQLFPQSSAPMKAAIKHTKDLIASLRPRESCSYPTNQGGGPIRFDCTSPALPGKAYCLEHDDLCFVKPAHRKQESPRGAKIEESCV